MYMQAALALALVTLSEASIGIFVKLVGDQIPIMSLHFYRVFFASIFLLVAVAMTNHGALRFPEKNLRDIAIIGALIAAQISLFNTAMSLAPVANVVIFWSIAPFFVFIFSSIFLGERPRRFYIFVFLLAFVGIAIAEPVRFDMALWSGEQLGNILALATGVVYAGVVTYLRKEGTTETNVDIFWFMLAASVYLAPLVAIFGAGSLFATSTTSLFGVTIPVVLWAAGLGFLSTGLAYFGISFVLSRINANVYSLIDIIVSPLIATLLAFMVFSEVPSTATVVGGVILLFAGALLTLLRNRRFSAPEPEKRVVR